MKKTVIETKTIVINTRNNEQFVSCEESISVSLDGSSRPVVILTREDGTEKEVSLGTFKRWYKTAEVQVETEVEVEDPKPETKPLTKHQKSALSNVEGAYTYVLGGYENSVQDGHIDEMPSVEVMFEEVYDEAMNSGHEMLGGMRMDGGPAPICVKFAGKKFIREQIAKLFRADGYEVPEELVAVPERKSGHSNFVDGERINLRKDEGEKVVNVRAFTGMLIGTFKVVRETKTTLTVKTNKGKLKFDKETGIQIDANNKKFANRIEL